MIAILATARLAAPKKETPPLSSIVRRFFRFGSRLTRGAAARPSPRPLRSLWSGTRTVLTFLGRLAGIGLLVLGAAALDRAVERKVDGMLADRSPHGGGKVLRFPGPRLEEVQ